MTNREKVIKGLKRVSNDIVDGYITEPDMVCNTINDAIALLKAQESVEPVPAIDNDGDWLCGNCYQSVVGEEELDASGFVPVKFNFCPNCGSAVKWE